MDLYPFKCPDCPRMFVLESSLQDHSAVCRMVSADTIDNEKVSETQVKHLKESAAKGQARARKRR